MSALEALNGTLLFELTTAFLFAMIREVGDIEKKHLQRVDAQGTHLGTQAVSGFEAHRWRRRGNGSSYEV